MFAEILRLVFGDHVVEGIGKEGEESIILCVNGISQTAILVAGDVIIVDVKG